MHANRTEILRGRLRCLRLIAEAITAADKRQFEDAAAILGHEIQEWSIHKDDCVDIIKHAEHRNARHNLPAFHFLGDAFLSAHRAAYEVQLLAGAAFYMSIKLEDREYTDEDWFTAFGEQAEAKEDGPVTRIEDFHARVCKWLPTVDFQSLDVGLQREAIAFEMDHEATTATLSEDQAEIESGNPLAGSTSEKLKDWLHAFMIKARRSAPSEIREKHSAKLRKAANRKGIPLDDFEKAIEAELNRRGE